jgi:hypothetical protein
MKRFSRRAFQQQVHDFLCAGISRTPPLAQRSGDTVILSMVTARDLVMYLGAVKSFYAQFGAGRVVVINDGTLAPEHLRQLRDNIKGIEILHIAEAPRRKVPRGGCWERLLWMAELAQGAYVIQLDADTLTRGPIPEVREAAARGVSFILSGDREGAHIVSREEISRAARLSSSRHVQIAIEQRLAGIEPLKPFYVRGSAGFFSLPKGALSLDAIEQWSETMERAIEGRWSEWGTEQATVNYLVANLDGTQVLQPPRYANRWRERPDEASAFIHFIGTNRFDGQYYARETRKTIRALQAPAAKTGDLAMAG